MNGNEALAPVIIRVKVQLVEHFGKLSLNGLKPRLPSNVEKELGLKLGKSGFKTVI